MMSEGLVDMGLFRRLAHLSPTAFGEVMMC